MLIERKEYLDKLLAWKDKQLIKVITGVRRCGKSTLMEMFQARLKKDGVGEKRILSVNFEDYDFYDLREPAKLYAYIKERLDPNAMNYIFLDEVQHVADFPRVVDSLYIKKNIDLYLTGSNAYMLSGEIATLLSGRYVEISMLPLSFREYVESTGSTAELGRKYADYLQNSSFPYTLELRDNAREIKTYLDAIYNTVVVKDIAARKKISDTLMLESVTRFLFDNIGNPLSSKKIADTLTSAGRKIDVKTVEKMIEGLTESFILYRAGRYNVKGKQYLKTMEKYYAVDIGLRYALLGSRNADVGHILENVVYLELLRRGYSVYVGKVDEQEVDFVAMDDTGNKYYQVAATVREQSTLQRELLPLQKIRDHYPKILDGCLYTVVKAFSELDLSIETFDSIRMGYIFENLIGRFYQNVDAGQFYTGRDIIKLLVEILMAEGCDDIFDDQKVITVCDQACGTGGMLSTAYNYIKHYNPTADVRLFGQELMGPSYAVGLAEMLIKNQDSENFLHVDTFKIDCFPDIKMRFVIENPPFGTPWSGKDAKDGQEQAVLEEYRKGTAGRWGHGLPSGGDSQMIFLQSAIDKMDETNGRAAIIENGSPLFNGDTGSGESQIRRWLLESDLLEAIIALPTDLFYNTGIQTYVWILSQNKRKERRGKVQLINADKFCHKLRKAVGDKKNEITPEDRKIITHLYADFEENENCKIFKNEEFMYREYAVYQPLQRSYAIIEERIEQMLSKGSLNGLYDEAKVAELENQGVSISDADKKKLEKFYANKPVFDGILQALRENVAEKVYLSPEPFLARLSEILTCDKKWLDKVADGLSVMDKTAEIQRDKKGNILYDKETKDIEIVKYEESIDDYMAREVLPHIPDAVAFFEENLNAKKPVIKVGAEIPFTRYFYKYQQPVPSEELEQKFLNLEKSVSERVKKLFGE